MNAHAQSIERGSLLNALTRMVRTRHELWEVGTGACRPVDVGERSVVALRYDAGGDTALMVNNLAPEPTSVQVPADQELDRPGGPAR